MPDILASVSVVLGAEVSGFKAAMADARRELKGLVQFSEGMRDIGKSLSTYVSLPLAALGTAAVAASAKMESLKKGVEAITAADLGKQGVTGLLGMQMAAQQAGDRLKALELIAKAPGIGFEQAVAGDIRLRAVGISATQSAKSLREFANAIATTGGGAGEFDRVTTQLAQLSAKGKVLSQDLRPIIEAAPAVSQALLKLYGTIDSETISASLTKQGKTSQDFIAVLTEELAKLPRVTGGLANAFENLQQTAVQSAAKLGDGISRALNLPGLTEGLASGIERLGNAFAGLSPGTQKLIIGLGLAAAAAGPILVAVGSLGVALPALTAGFSALGITSAAAFGPIGLVAVAVGAAALLIIENWDSLTAYFSTGPGATLFRDLASSAASAAESIGQAFATLRANAGGSLGDLITASGIFQQAFREAGAGVASILNVLSGTITAFNSLLTGDFSQAADGAKQAFLGLIEPVRSLLFGTREQAVATQVLLEKFDALATLTPGLAQLLNSLGAATPFPVANLGAATRQLGLLEELKSRLKEVQDQRDKETTVGAIKVDNAEIISLQKQIAALEGTDKAGKKATDAIIKLRQELARLTALDNLLGDTPNQLEVLERRSDTLLKGLKTLVDAGVSPGSRAFRDFAQEAVTLGQQLDKLKGGGGSLDLKPVKVRSLIPQTIGDTLPQDVARLLGDYAKQAKPFELPLPVKLNMQAITEARQPVQLLNRELLALGDIKVQPKFDGLVSKSLNAELLNLGAAFRQIDGGAQLGVLFDEAGAKASVLQSAIQNLLANGTSPLDANLQQLGAQFKQLSIDAQGTQAIKASIMDLAGGISDAFAQAASGAQGIGTALLQTLLSTVGNLATQLGGIILAAGLGIEALKASLASFTGVGAIAAGLGLLAIGGIAKGAAASLGKSAGSGVSTPSPSNYGQNSNQTTIKVIGELRLRTDEMVAALRQADYRSEVSG